MRDIILIAAGVGIYYLWAENEKKKRRTKAAGLYRPGHAERSTLPKGIPETHREAWEAVKRCAPREGITVAQAYQLWIARGYSNQDPQRLISLGC